MPVAAAVLLTSMWLYFAGAAALRSLWQHLRPPRGGRAAGRGTGMLRSALLVSPFMKVLAQTRIFDHSQLLLSSYHTKLIILNGSEWSMDLTKKEAAAAVGAGYMAIMGCAWLSALADEPLLLAFGALLGIVLPLRTFVDTARKVEQPKTRIIMELPNLLSKLMLLVGAGETVQRALDRCLEGKELDGHPLYKEWHIAILMLRSGHSFSASMERFNRSCAVQEVSVFTTVLLLNYRRGGEHFVLALRELSYAMWEKRKSIARAKGEEASAKLVFPLVGILLVLMVLIAAPALLLMS